MLKKAIVDSTLSNFQGRLYHPAPTLLARPDLALYVRDITETAAVHRIAPRDHPNITETTLAALRLCKKLRRISWNDDSNAGLHPAIP